MTVEKQTCVICQTEIASIDATSLPCTHTFHFSCMFDYIENKVDCQMDIDCPLCRCNHFNVNSNEYAYLRHQVSEKQNIRRKEQGAITLDVHQIRPIYPIQPTRQYKHHKRNSSGCLSLNNSESLQRKRKIILMIIISMFVGIALGVAFGTNSIKV